MLRRIDIFEFPENLYYTREHMWIKVLDNGLVLVGLDDFFQKLANMVAAVTLPSIGDVVQQGKTFFSVEFIKSVVDIVSQISGEVKEVNFDLEDSPELINDSPYDKGWIAIIKTSNIEAELSSLITESTLSDWITQEIEKNREQIDHIRGVWEELLGT